MSHKTVYLIRHGRTCGNEEKRYTGCRTDEPLSISGRQQAEKMSTDGLTPAEVTVDRVCSGPMKRAAETAYILFGCTKPELIDGLTEMDLGIFEGKTHAQLEGDRRYRDWIDSNGDLDIPGGEKKKAFVKRSMEGFVNALGDPDKDETIAVVCHGGNIMAIVTELFGGRFYDHMTENLGGYRIEAEMDDEGIHGISFCRIDTGDTDRSGGR